MLAITGIASDATRFCPVHCHNGVSQYYLTLSAICLNIRTNSNLSHARNFTIAAAQS
jgi:hypothetical protein